MTTNLEKALQVGDFERYHSDREDLVECTHPEVYGRFKISEKVPGKIVAGGYWYEIDVGGGTSQYCWAVDENSQCWFRFFDEGENFEPIDEKDLADKCKSVVLDPDMDDLSLGALRGIRIALGKKPFPPRWIRMALKAGCTFPDSINLDQYDLENS